MEKSINRNKFEKHEISSFFDDDTISKELRRCLATGNFGKTSTGEVVKTGVAQVILLQA
jgi:hypothetical protein